MTVKQKKYTLIGLDCANCAEKINRSINSIKGVKEATVSFVSRELFIEFITETDIEEIDVKIKKTIKALEPNIKVENKTSEIEKKNTGEIKSTVIHISVCVLFLALGVVFEKLDLPFIVSLLMFIASYLSVGYRVIISAFKNIIKGEIFDENFLMLIATAGAFAIREFTEAVAVMLFYQIGEMFQSMAVNNSRKSISDMMDIRPDYANVKRGGKLITVKPDEVHVGDIIVIKAGEKIPLDGVIISGSTSIDTSSLTGESVPYDCAAGDTVLSGSLNINGLIEVEVSHESSESTVQKILELVESAETKKSKTENFITRFAKIYTPVVVLVSVIIAVVVPLVFNLGFYEWIYRGLLFLIVSCPCALVISVPLSYFSGIGKASKEGILIKGGNYLDVLANTSTVVFDKTGTLTKGNFKVDEIRKEKNFSVNDLLETAAYAEYFSNHPIAAAVKNEFRGVVYENRISDYNEISGEGVSVNIDGLKVLAGNSRLMKRYNISCPELDQTHIHIAINNEYAGNIIISDEEKATSRETIMRLKELGVTKTVMLTGDNKKSAESVAQKLGINEVFSQLLPQDKSTKLDALENALKKGESLVYVGDGINDTPVLKRADVGIAMGGLGSDSAIEAADAVIMNDEPVKLVTVIKIARYTKKVVWQNIFLALGVKFIIQIFGIMGFADMWMAVFADVGVTIIAVLNSVRLLRKKI